MEDRRYHVEPRPDIRARTPILAADDPRVTCLGEDIASMLDDIESLDIALSNRDYVSVRVSETTAHEILDTVKALLRTIAEPRPHQKG